MKNADGVVLQHLSASLCLYSVRNFHFQSSAAVQQSLSKTERSSSNVILQTESEIGQKFMLSPSLITANLNCKGFPIC